MASRRVRIEGAIVLLATVAIAIFYVHGAKQWRFHQPRYVGHPTHSTSR